MAKGYTHKMEIREHIQNGISTAEVISNEIIINSADDALELMGNMYYQGYDKIIMYQKNITPDFFDLKNGMAGDILQKFSNFRIGLAIIGDFTIISSKSLKDFIYESNRGKQVNFFPSVNEALK